MPDNVHRESAPRGVAVRDVRVDLSGAPVLRGVSLEAGQGAQLAILGPSGCGKTTLLRVIAGLQPVDGGEVWLGEQRVAAPGVLENDSGPVMSAALIEAPLHGTVTLNEDGSFSYVPDHGFCGAADGWRSSFLHIVSSL